MATDPGVVIQFGSGHPGEAGSARFEAALFEELELKDPNVLFFPFHSMPPDSGDLALFKQIYGEQTDGWIRSIQLEPPRWPVNSAEIFTLIEEADVIVMGSGFPEPFSRLMFRLGLPQRFRQLHKKGTHFFGYSAGTLTLSEGYYLPFTGEDLLIQLGLLDHISMPDAKRAEMEESMLAVVERDDARGFVEAIRAANDARQELSDEQAEFVQSFLWMEQARGFGLTPGITVNPHYGEQFQYRRIHLKHLSNMFPQFLHVGVPNGTALVSKGPAGSRDVTFRGRNPIRQAHYKRGDGELVEMHDGDEVPAVA